MSAAQKRLEQKVDVLLERTDLLHQQLNALAEAVCPVCAPKVLKATHPDVVAKMEAVEARLEPEGEEDGRDDNHTH